MKELDITLHVRQYIANPYWAAREKIVNIQKESGMNRARSNDRKEAALRTYLERIGMEYGEYEALEREANEPWYKNKDGWIVIPRHHMSGCLIQACNSSPPAGAKFRAAQFRSLVQISDFVTDRREKDTVFERFILPTDGKGNKLSNQRRLTSNEVIENFVARGTMTFDPSDVKEDSLVALLTYAGKYIGIGSSRLMGYGRFSVEAL